MPWLRSLLALLWCSAVALAADWPQWLGPNRDGASPEKVTPWKNAPKVLWHKEVGEGHSGPVVADGKVFLLTVVSGKDEEAVTAYDAKTGNLLWQTTYKRAKFQSEFGNGPRATPAVVKDHVYTFGVTGVLTCLQTKSGNKVWQVDTLAKFKAPNLKFGMSCSPLIDGNRLFVNVGGKGASLVAFDKDKGTVLWQNLDDPASYSSPIAYDQGGKRQVVFLTQKGVVALNPVDGAPYWKFPLVDRLSESSTTPERFGDILVASSVTYGAVGLRLETKDNKPSFTQVWRKINFNCYFSTPVGVGKEHAYFVTGAFLPKIQVILRCVEIKTGSELWRKDKIGQYHASLLRTGDDKLLLLDDAGNLMLLDPNPKEYRELARSKVCGSTWAHPALANGKLYVRDRKELICLQLGEEK
jgi:outer membrane protein assembly factor BamB